MPRRLTSEQAALWRDIIRGIRAVDVITDRMARDIIAIVRSYPERGVLTTIDQMVLRRRINQVVDRTFGASRSLALRSDLFRVIVGSMDASAEGVFRRSFEGMRDIIERRDPNMWRQLDAKLLLGGNGPQDELSVLNRMLHGDHVARERLLRSKTLDPQRKWVPKERWNTKTGYRLSDRLWLQSRRVRAKINNQIREAIANGTDPIQLARDLEEYLADYAKSKTIYAPDGTIVQRVGQTESPRGGWGNTAARRLARTEIVRVNGAAVVESGKIVPGVSGIKWLLSNGHVDQDVCTDLASRDDFGLGRGVYPVEQVPQYPQHPNEMCTLAHAHVPREQMINEIATKYRLLADEGLAA